MSTRNEFSKQQLRDLLDVFDVCDVMVTASLETIPPTETQPALKVARNALGMGGFRELVWNVLEQLANTLVSAKYEHLGRAIHKLCANQLDLKDAPQDTGELLDTLLVRIAEAQVSFTEAVEKVYLQSTENTVKLEKLMRKYR